MQKILSELKRCIILTIILVVILCLIYPVMVWAISQLLFPCKSNGAFIVRDNTKIGSELIAQRFADPGYFHPRPSSADDGYDARSSSGSNLGPISKELIARSRRNIEAYRLENELSPDIPIPPDAVTASASGLDPHISVDNAFLQAERVAKNRNLDKQSLIKMIQSMTQKRQLGLFGEPRINVLLLNLKLDEGNF